jgi:anti-sigma factor RsiW
MSQDHLSQEEMMSFTRGLLDKQKTDAVVAHLQKCAACHQQQSQMAMAARLTKMKEINEHNQKWTCSDPFWGLPYPYARATSPPLTEEIRKWEDEHKSSRNSP